MVDVVNWKVWRGEVEEVVSFLWLVLLWCLSVGG